MNRKQFDEQPYYQAEQSFYDQELQQERSQKVALYLAKVMGWMCVGLLVTMVTAIVCIASPAVRLFLFGTPFTFYGVFAIQLALVFMFSFLVNKINAFVAKTLYLLYSAFTGVTFSVLAVIFTLPSILSIFGITSLIFLGLAVYGYTTKRDLTGLGTLALFGLIGVILMSLINMFMGNTMVDLILCCFGIVIFLALIAYDTQKIKDMYLSASNAGYDDSHDQMKKLAISGAFTLYLDFINLFLRLLQLLGNRRN